MNHLPCNKKNDLIAKYESLKFGVFSHFNMQPFAFDKRTEYATSSDPALFNPADLDVEQWFRKWSEAGVRYAVLTTKHTGDFCLWDTKTVETKSTNSPCKTDIVKEFLKYGKMYNIEIGLYYCLWGGSYNYNENAKQIILNQLEELTTEYSGVLVYWLDMANWKPEDLSCQQLYNFIKDRAPESLVHFNQHVQDGSEVHYFPTDVVNGEQRTPPDEGHNKNRNILGTNYYLPFEAEFCLQQVDDNVGFGYVNGTRWFTYTKSETSSVQSRPIETKVLYPYIKQAYERGASNVLLSTAADWTGMVRDIDIAALKEIRQLIKNDFGF